MVGSGTLAMSASSNNFKTAKELKSCDRDTSRALPTNEIFPYLFMNEKCSNTSLILPASLAFYWVLDKNLTSVCKMRVFLNQPASLLSCSTS